MKLEIGKYYEVNAKKVRGIQTRRVMLYQGQDLGRNYTFVDEVGMLKVAESQIMSINPVQTSKPQS